MQLIKLLKAIKGTTKKELENPELCPCKMCGEYREAIGKEFNKPNKSNK